MRTDYYDWPKIVAVKSNEDLKQILKNKEYEPVDKVNSAIIELKKRNILDADFPLLENSEKQIKKYDSVGGWLLLLCFSLLIGTPIRTLYNLSLPSIESLGILSDNPSLKSFLVVDGVLAVVIMILSIRAGIALWTNKPKAVKTTKNYLLVLLSYSVIAAFLPFIFDFSSAYNDGLVLLGAEGFIKSTIYVGIWYWYLCDSKRVQYTYFIQQDNKKPEECSLDYEKV
ncbi:MAG: DUF2569 domain-containing protein [Marinifilaceae bacterium]|jgi:hypothetical protein|nr:DUF2569 domain-containing protein [Marinifilaceae bacterium]